ncbi:MAG: membrane protein insertase YidC [Oscillospiraceae bacterium]|nr:membrane protein insertase YidC [Oscillospiraceae bacterium]
MSLINTCIGIPLGWIMYLCYRLLKSYGLAILLFTLISKVILLPLSIVVQKNSIKMIRLQPEINRITIKHFGDKDTITDETMALYKREKYSPALGMVPMIIQIILVLGLINVIYNPMQHLMHVPVDVCNQLVTATASLLGVQELGSGAQLKVMEAMCSPANLDYYMGLNLPGVDMAALIEAAKVIDTQFLGINLAKVPPLLPISLLSMVPLLSCLSTYLLCWAQNRDNVLQKEQGFLGRWGVTIFTVAFSTYFTFLVPAGVGVYWIVSNVFAIGNLYLMNALYQPKKYIDYEALESSKTELSALKAKEDQRKKALEPYKKQEKEDYKRFLDNKEPKQLVFYSEGSGFYKYFAGMIDYVLKNSDVVIHYITSDPQDAVFQMNEPKLKPYYIGEMRLITLMMKLEADMVIMTMPDLETYHIKRSLVRKDIEYVYTDHGVSSDNMTLRTHALDHFDTLFCVGPHQMEEARAIEKLYDLKPRRLVQVGYGLLDEMTAAWEAKPKTENDKKTVLIAPSWQKDNIMDSCLDKLVEQILPLGVRLIIRPHPQYVRLYGDKMDAIINRYQEQLGDDFIIQTDFSSTDTVYSADLLITDWSNVGYEFALSTLKPVFYVNTPMKIMNPEYDKIDVVPFDIRIRAQLGGEVELDNLDTVGESVKNLLDHPDEYREIIRSVKEKEIYNLGHGAEAAGRYIVKRLETLKARRGG